MSDPLGQSGGEKHDLHCEEEIGDLREPEGVPVEPELDSLSCLLRGLKLQKDKNQATSQQEELVELVGREENKPEGYRGEEVDRQIDTSHEFTSPCGRQEAEVIPLRSYGNQGGGVSGECSYLVVCGFEHIGKDEEGQQGGSAVGRGEELNSGKGGFDQPVEGYHHGEELVQGHHHGDKFCQSQEKVGADEIGHREEEYCYAPQNSATLQGILPCTVTTSQAFGGLNRSSSDHSIEQEVDSQIDVDPAQSREVQGDIEKTEKLEVHRHESCGHEASSPRGIELGLTQDAPELTHNVGEHDEGKEIEHESREVFGDGIEVGDPVEKHPEAHDSVQIQDGSPKEYQDRDEIGQSTEARIYEEEMGHAGEKPQIGIESGKTQEHVEGVEITKGEDSGVVEIKAEDLAAQFTKLELQREDDEARRDKQRKLLVKGKDNELDGVFTPLLPMAEIAVNEALVPSKRQEVLVFHKRSNIEVTRAVIQCLLPGAWLNDEVINVYMELLKERELREPGKFLKCHFFNTFFYNKLFKDSRSYDYQAVQRWTTYNKLGYSLLECDKVLSNRTKSSIETWTRMVGHYGAPVMPTFVTGENCFQQILVPIHQDVHWCLAVIDVRMKRLLYLDSLKGRDNNVLQALAQYIADEAREKAAQQLDVSKWQHVYVDDIPKQRNGCDCGMFMLKYSDFHSRGALLSFTQAHMNYFRRRTVWEILQLKAS